MKQLTTILLASLAFAACGDNEDDIDDIGDGDGDGQPPPSTRVWRADLAGIGPYSALVGQSTVQQAAGATSFSATASIRNDLAGASRPWHVHVGTCATGGAIVGPPNAYPLLVVGSDGSASANVRIDVPLELGASYHVNVHLSAAQLDTIIACGDLVRSQ